jgi:hypothetical protein
MLSRIGRFLYKIAVGSFGPGKRLMGWLNGAYLVASIWLGYKLNELPVWIEVRGIDLTVGLGWIVSILMIVLFLAFKAGPAWVDSGTAAIRFDGIIGDVGALLYYVNIKNEGLKRSNAVNVFITEICNSSDDHPKITNLEIPIELSSIDGGIEQGLSRTVKIGKIGLKDKLWPQITIEGKFPAHNYTATTLRLDGRQWAGNETRIYMMLVAICDNKQARQWVELTSTPSEPMCLTMAEIKKPPKTAKGPRMS